jgi:DNA-3-methyladenine glycosylase II
MVGAHLVLSRTPGEVSSPPVALDEARLAVGAAELTASDADLRAVVDRHGMPPLWAREAGFQTLLKIILEQQVTLQSGQAAYDRLERVAGAIEPQAIVDVGEAGGRAAGLTRQKARYVVALAAAVEDGSLDVGALAELDDEAVRGALLAIPGIGPWTADVYLLMALRRPDAWPTADIALAASAQFVKRLSKRPSASELDAMAESWRPWRAVAARLLWHSYLSGDRPRPTNGSAG